MFPSNNSPFTYALLRIDNNHFNVCVRNRDAISIDQNWPQRILCLGDVFDFKEGNWGARIAATSGAYCGGRTYSSLPHQKRQGAMTFGRLGEKPSRQEAVQEGCCDARK